MNTNLSKATCKYILSDVSGQEIDWSKWDDLDFRESLIQQANVVELTEDEFLFAISLSDDDGNPFIWKFDKDIDVNELLGLTSDDRSEWDSLHVFNDNGTKSGVSL